MPVKPGWKTTEFWLCLAAGVAATLQGLVAADSPAAAILTALIAALAALGYTCVRAGAKIAQAVIDDADNAV